MPLQTFKIDLHIHTALSPCAEKEMTPAKIVHAARAKGLAMIAVTDHNTAENVDAVCKAAAGSGVFVVPGMEVQSREEVHLICLFPSLETCMSWQETVYRSLPDLPNRPDVFGPQLIMDSTGGVVRELERMLLVSTTLSVEQVVGAVTALGGLCIPAHVDRPSFSLLATLGFIPQGLNVRGVEISRHVSRDEAHILHPSLLNYTLVSSSDAHCLTDVGANPTVLVCQGPPSFAELALALVQTSGRKVIARMKDLAMHIIDIVQNSIEAEATEVKLVIREDTATDRFTIEISDNGRGMDQETMAKVIDPFFTTRTTRRVGLGLPLLKAAAERTEGNLVINSAPGQGTSVTASFRHSHIDRAPLGNIVDAVVNLIVGAPDLNLCFSHQIDGREVLFNAAELREQLEDVPLNNPAILNWIKKFLTESYAELQKTD